LLRRGGGPTAVAVAVAIKIEAAVAVAVIPPPPSSNDSIVLMSMGGVFQRISRRGGGGEGGGIAVIAVKRAVSQQISRRGGGERGGDCRPATAAGTDDSIWPRTRELAGNDARYSSTSPNIGFSVSTVLLGGGLLVGEFFKLLSCIKHFYIFSPSIFIVILVSTPFDSIPLKSVCREPSDGSHPKQSLHSIGSIIVLIVTLIW
jgi:hypothetical protein